MAAESTSRPPPSCRRAAREARGDDVGRLADQGRELPGWDLAIGR
jgi:hypothetical protein